MAGRFEQWRETVSEESTLDVIADWYHVPVLVALVAFMLWTRLRPVDNFVRGDEVFFGGNDAYYHFREIGYIVAHWPRTMPFDPWTAFPYGTSADQFGTLYDQIIATAAIIVGLGAPTEHTIAMTLLVAPAVFGALVAVPVYLIGQRIGGRPGGLFAVFVLAVLPGTFFHRSLAGFSDHHVAEVLFQSIAVLTSMVAVSVAERERPIVEQFVERAWSGLRPTLAWGGLAGVALGLYLWTWPPGVVLVGILGVFYLVALTAEVVRDRSPEHVAIVGVLSLLVAFVMTALRLDEVSGFGSSTSLNPMHLSLLAGVALGCVFLTGLFRFWDANDVSPGYYPVVVGGLVVTGAAAIWAVLPDLYGQVVGSALTAFGFGQTDTILTIQEAQAVPFDQLGSFLLLDYGLLFLPAIGGLALLVWDAWRTDDYRTEWLLVVIWAVFTTMMALTQIRFNYYLAAVVAVLNGLVFARLLPLLNLPDRMSRLAEVKGYQVMVLLAVAMFVVVPVAPGVTASNVVTQGESYGPGSVVLWDDSLDWMDGNTPQEGTYGDASQPMPYYGTFEETDDFEYPPGAYGVMSWWDYGHWITVNGQRIPVANPFQQNARPASAFFLAESEDRANLLLEALPSDSNAYSKSSEELRATVENQGEQEASEDTRYVIIDDQMAGGKFHAIATWTGPPQSTYFRDSRFQYRGQNVTLTATGERYDQTMLSRLYYGDAHGLANYRLVHEVDSYAAVGGYASNNRADPLRRLPLNGDWSAIGPTASQIDQAQRNGQMVSIGGNQFVYDAQVESRVKIYERVPGATLTGTVPNASNGTAVYALVTMETHTGRQFTYLRQTTTDDDGSFAMTVSYATDDSVGVEEGGTNSSVRAVSDYAVRVGHPLFASANGTATVPESAIYDGETIEVPVQPVGQGEDGNSSASMQAPGEPFRSPTGSRLASQPLARP